jgi:tetratricopeptide (TPR) repeat protein
MILDSLVVDSVCVDDARGTERRTAFSRNHAFPVTIMQHPQDCSPQPHDGSSMKPAIATTPSDGDESERHACPPPPRPPISVATSLDLLLAGGEGRVPTVGPFRAETLLVPPDAVPGYAILEELGRGGMGVVYKARQAGLNRLVAIKMIRGGSGAGPNELARFRAEAEAVARLHHPNIIQIHEIGEADGRPYLSLEYVDGGSLAAHLAHGPLPVPQAVELIETLAQAVAFAHRCGIVHRDLKPANILLQTRETTVPKIADFGLAKLLDEEASKTQTGSVLGTPNYMAPEQAGGARAEVGPAADVYALGAVLYEMLTSRPPFSGATPLDTLDQVRTRDPIPPRQLQPNVPRDLETICLKCLQKDRQRRYSLADDLAADLRRLRTGEPIRARPITTLERALKWVRRRPATAALAACSIIAAVALLIVGLAYHFKLQSALRATEKHRNRAETYNQKLREAVDSLLTEVGDKDLADIPQMEETRVRLFEKALKFHEDLLQEDDADPASQFEKARLLNRIAWLNQWMGRLQPAETYALRSVHLFEQFGEELSGEKPYGKELGNAYAVLGHIYSSMGRAPATENAYREAKKILESLPLDEPRDRIVLASICTLLGTECIDHRPEEAKALFARALTLVEEGPPVEGTNGVLTQNYLGRGLLHQKKGRTADAETAYKEGLVVGQKAVREARWVGMEHFSLAQIHHNLALLRRANPKDAEEGCLKALALCQQLRRRHPRVPVYAKELVSNHESLAGLYFSTGHPAKAESHLRDAETIYLSGAVGGLIAPERLAGDYNMLGLILVQTNRLAEAESELRKALKVLEQLVHAKPPDRSPAIKEANTLFLFGFLKQQQEKPKEALDFYNRSIGLLEAAARQAPLDESSLAILHGSQDGRAALGGQGSLNNAEK